MRQRVVLPVPLGPQRPMRSPRPIRHDTSRSSPCPPYPLETVSSAITRSPLLAHGLDAVERHDAGHAHLFPARKSLHPTGMAVMVSILSRRGSVVSAMSGERIVISMIARLSTLPAIMP